MDLEDTEFGYFGLGVLHFGTGKIVDDDLSSCKFSVAFCINLFRFLKVFDSLLFIYYL
jgi:hypothetical protein